MDDKSVLKLVHDNPQCFEIIYDEYYNTIFNYIFKRTDQFDLSKDICSEVFLKAYTSINKFKWKGIPILSWLYKIATNEINLFYRSNKYIPKLVENTYENRLHKYYNSKLDQERIEAEKEIRKHDQFVKIRNIIGCLPLKYQEVLTLRFFEQLSIKEISHIINKNENTIKTLIHRGLDKIRKTYSEQEVFSN